MTSPNPVQPVLRPRTSLPRRITRHLLGLILVTQPAPSFVATLSVAVFAVLAAHQSGATLDPGPLVRLLASIECTQIAIGAINDAHDYVADLGTPRLKPIARGWIARWEAVALGSAAAIAALLFAWSLSPSATALVAVIEALGLSYDLWLKGTAASGLLWAFGFPLSPLLAWVVFGRWMPFLPWLVPLGAVLGVAINIANALPDLDIDRSSGVRGLPHLLGLHRGLALAWSLPLVVLAAMWALDLTGAVAAQKTSLLVATVCGAGSVALASLAYSIRPRSSTLRANFFIQALGAIALGAAWLVAVSS